MERKKRRSLGEYETKQEFEERIFPWMTAIALVLVIIYVAVSVLIDPWLFIFIPLGICVLFFLGFCVLGIGAALTSALSTMRELMEG